MDVESEQDIETELKDYIESSLTKRSGLFNIEWMFESYQLNEIFEAIYNLTPDLTARIKIDEIYEEEFNEWFRYPKQEIATLAQATVKYNNGKLLQIVQGFSRIPSEYRLYSHKRNISSKEDVSELKSTLSNLLYNGFFQSIINVYIEHPNYKELLKQGIVPHPEIEGIRNILRFYKENRTNEDLRFWVGKQYSELENVQIWCVFKLEYLERYRNRVDSYPFLFTYPDELYSSFRTKTNMNLFRLPSSMVYDDINYRYSEEFDLIPVIRYAKSMSGSLYFGKTRPADICGRFYYYEPESETFLQYRKGRMLKGFNKTDIYHKMYNDVKILDRQLAAYMKQEYIAVIKQGTGRQVELHRIGSLRENLNYTSYETYTMFDIEYADGSRDIPPQSTDTFYVGTKIGMYAAEDEFDQVLCKAAKLLDYDIVFFESMVGSHQVVSEILDVRTDSFNHLVFKR